MQWTDEGIVIGVRRLGEADAILEAMTAAHGRHLGLVRGGAGARLRPVLQPGNTVSLVWRARLDEHLGHFAVEGLGLRAAAFLQSAHMLFALGHLCALMRLLPERDPHPALHARFERLLDSLDDPGGAALHVARFELQVLAELGFGLDLDRCVLTGTREDLAYVSPKSGRAVSRTAGEPWRDKLFALPQWLRASAADEPALPDAVVLEAFKLTGFFLARHAFEPKGQPLPHERAQFLSAVLQKLRVHAALDS